MLMKKSKIQNFKQNHATDAKRGKTGTWTKGGKPNNWNWCQAREKKQQTEAVPKRGKASGPEGGKTGKWRQAQEKHTQLRN